MTGDVRKDSIINNGIAIAAGVLCLLLGFIVGVNIPDDEKPQKPVDNGPVPSAQYPDVPPGAKNCRQLDDHWWEFEWEGRKWVYNGRAMVDTTSSEAYQLPEPEVRRIYDHMHKGGWVSIEQYPDGIYVRLRRDRIKTGDIGSMGAPPPPEPAKAK